MIFKRYRDNLAVEINKHMSETASIPKETFDAENWENKITNEPIKEILRKWEKKVEWTNQPFTRFYVACPDKKLEPFVKYLRATLSIDDKSAIELDVNSQKMDTTPELINLKNQFQSLVGDRILVVAKKFERLFEDLVRDKNVFSITRFGHDYDQTAKESRKLNEAYKDFDKKIVILTHIGKSMGKEVYEAALGSALQSQFRDGIIEIE